ncbi:extracellular solute-binding protein [Paenibacillus sp. S150]|uniref:extracellular solute-binding protein n=1 Tax=Paenibacillus sp. S150 TaxID=2749826 RepID=UPI001C59DD57|nr:extracellular solute-binding protein [Paenibacillus sp. S150]MBW4082492.1 extracellular solute-binding protein [Paenibacillus sp. S150]
MSIVRGLKGFTLLIAAAVSLAACGSNGSNPASEDTVQGNSPSPSAQVSGNTEKKTLRILSGVAGGKTPEENAQFEAEVQRLTGIEAEIEKPAADYSKKLMAALAGGEQYDLVYMGKTEMDQLVEQGVLMRLNDRIEASAVLSDPQVIEPAEWEQVKYGGDIYSILNKKEGGTLPIVRQDWLDKLNLAQPATLDEFYKVLKAFKEQDPDGNGKDDTYGLSTSGLYDIQGFMSAAGVKYRYVLDDSGKRSIPYATEAAVPVYEWFAKLYKEGILDPNFATNDTGKMREMFLTDRVGMVTYWDAWVGLFNNMRQTEDPDTAFEAKGIKGAVSPDGSFMLRRGDPSVWGIPVNAEHPETAIEFMEFWHSEPGNILSTLGIENVDWTPGGSGGYELTATGAEHGMDHGAPFPSNTNFVNPVGTLPGALEAREIIFSSNSTIELSTADWPNAEKIVQNYAFKAMMGEIPAAEAVKSMNAELKSAGLID